MINKNITCNGILVNIRSLNISDSNSVKSWENIDETKRYFPNQNFINDIKNENWITSKLNDENGFYFMIIDVATKTTIGITIIENIDSKRLIASWGIYLAKPEFIKKEYAYESALLILNFAFSKLNLKKIHACSLSTNNIGRKFHKSLGFVEDAVFNNQIFIDGYYCDLIWISLIKEDFYISIKNINLNRLQNKFII